MIKANAGRLKLCSNKLSNVIVNHCVLARFGRLPAPKLPYQAGPQSESANTDIHYACVRSYCL